MTSNFVPKRRLMSDITNATAAEVTTTEAHGYEVGQLLRFVVPEEYGLLLNYKVGKVKTVPSDTTFTTDIDTSALADFVAPTAPPSFTQAHVTPITGTEKKRHKHFGVTWYLAH